MIGLRLTFTAGRYHATGWDHHVNEGVSEWPPSPWRILRALVAASYRLDEGEREQVPELLERLTSLPVYRLPPSSTAHVRHYMPTRWSPVKVLDTFVAIGDGARDPGEVLVWWPTIELTEFQRDLLCRLSEQIGYLGRAESWVEVSVMDEVDTEPNARPVTEDDAGADGVRLLAAQSAEQLTAWRERWKGAAGNDRKGTSGPAVPRSVWDVLNVDTGQLQRDRWSQAPGSRWVAYRLDDRPRVRPRPRKQASRGPQGAVFLLESAVRPTIEQTLLIAERMRSAVMSMAKDRERAPWQFSGKGERGEPLQGHAHAYFLPLSRRDNVGREVVDRVLIWARDGLEPDAWADLQSLASSGRRLRGSADDHPLRLILAGYGDIGQLASIACLDPQRPRESWFGPSKTWVSATPFMPPRHTKVRRGNVIDGPEDQLCELAAKVLGRQVEHTELVAGERGGAFGWNRFVRVRKKHRDQMSGRSGFGFRISFAEEVEGPVALGYGAHFGLGLFRPVDRTD